MAMAFCKSFNGTLAAVACIIISIVSLAFFRSQEARIPAHSRFDYRPTSWFRECAQWDPIDQRFIVSFMEGGLGQIKIDPPAIAHEQILVKDPDLRANSTLGFKLDHPRHRLLAAVSDQFGHSFSALAAYDTRTWERIFLTVLAGPETRSLANDVAVDEEGNAYVTDSRRGLIWRVSWDGKDASVLTDSPIFKLNSTKMFSPLVSVTLNGIAYHPDGYLLVSHTGGDALFKVSIDGKHVHHVDGDPVPSGDGIALVSSHQLAVAGLWGVRLVESKDQWETAHVTHLYAPPIHRLATAVTMKDGIVCVNFFNGFGIPYTSTIAIATFNPFATSSISS